MSQRISEDRKRLAARLYLANNGNAAKTAKQLGVSRWNFGPNKWLGQEWWNETLESVRQEIDSESLARQRHIVELADSAVISRLINGDERLQRDGTISNVAVTARDAALIASISRDKLRIAEGKPTRITADLASLMRLRDELAGSAKGLTLEPESNPLPVKKL